MLTNVKYHTKKIKLLNILWGSEIIFSIYRNRICEIQKKIAIFAVHINFKLFK